MEQSKRFDYLMQRSDIEISYDGNNGKTLIVAGIGKIFSHRFFPAYNLCGSFIDDYRS
jgi:hypothetical protein